MNKPISTKAFTTHRDKVNATKNAGFSSYLTNKNTITNSSRASTCSGCNKSNLSTNRFTNLISASNNGNVTQTDDGTCVACDTSSGSSEVLLFDLFLQNLKANFLEEKD